MDADTPVKELTIILFDKHFKTLVLNAVSNHNYVCIQIKLIDKK